GLRAAGRNGRGVLPLLHTAADQGGLWRECRLQHGPRPDDRACRLLRQPGSRSGRSGPCAAASCSGEATLDIEWAYSIAPLAHIVLLAVPPAETLGVQGFPNLFKAISGEITATPPGTVFSMSLAATEQTFGGAAAAQTARFDQVFQAGLAKHDNF